MLRHESLRDERIRCRAQQAKDIAATEEMARVDTVAVALEAGEEVHAESEEAGAPPTDDAGDGTTLRDPASDRRL